MRHRFCACLILLGPGKQFDKVTVLNALDGIRSHGCSSHQHLASLGFFSLSIAVLVQSYHVRGLIGTSLITVDIKHPLLCLLALCISSLCNAIRICCVFFYWVACQKLVFSYFKPIFTSLLTKLALPSFYTLNSILVIL